MLLKTHLVFAVFVILLFVSHVNNKLVFVGLVLASTVFLDIDSSHSSLGRYLVFRPFQFLVRHRGFIHSFTLAFVFSALLAIFWPVGSFGFFVGYSLHLITDSFTKEGIQPFWPLKARSRGVLRSGGRVEETIFLSMFLINVILFFIIFIF
ncbi:hypothetical protein GF386_03950 [Candidatus Pacearchaeota archaeon]|nr:hypothetical protein [Candidatus Pacearchaeota archaeon]MBD3283301.1 hypothetical protein [Candidatus Pacearchaeota archaeon]